jgi:hypothetical protein
MKDADGFPSQLVRDELVVRARQSLEPAGWTVSVRDEPLFAIKLSHPLTSNYTINFNGEGDPEARLDRALAHREFGVIARAEVVNDRAQLLGHLRVAAAGDKWPRSVLYTVGAILARSGFLSQRDALWLEDAGPSWTE